MSQRERQPSGGAVEAAPRPAAGQPVPPRPPPSQKLGAKAAPLWEDLFRAAPPAQQMELLSLAGRQGVLYAHQLPSPTNGSAGDPGRQLVAHLLSGQSCDLHPVRPGPVAVFDTDLDDAQREAVARALSTPDVCLIQGLPGTGKSRVVAEIITQAADRGDRVLLLAPTTAAIDRVLELTGGRPSVCPVRCLSRDEQPDALPPAVRALSFDERVRSLKEGSLQCAHQGVESAERRCVRRRQDEPRWTGLQELAQRGHQLEEEDRVLQGRRARVPVEVEREVAAAEAGAGDGALAAAIRACAKNRDEALANLDSTLAELCSQRDKHRQERDALQAQLDGLQPLVTAKQHKQWWTAAWWRATFQADVRARHADLESQREKITGLLGQVEEQTRQATAAREQALALFQAERRSCALSEAGRREAELDDRDAALRQESKLLHEKWQAACAELDAETPHPAAVTPAAVEAAHEAWRDQLHQEEVRGDFARQWLAYLQEHAEALPARFLECVNLVAATTTSLAGDAHFGDGSARGRFDLLVLEEADQVTESEFASAARRARRWVLVGEPAADPVPEEKGAGRTSSDTRGKSARLHTPASLRPGFFQRLWQQLHCDPRRLPYAWVHEQDRLCCRLRTLTPEERTCLECERVADFPDIELRIFTLPRQEPVLAEVVFPPSMTICQAKEFIYRELQELPVCTSGRGLDWHESADRLVLRLADAPAGHEVAVHLEPGVREMIAGNSPESNGAPAAEPRWYTCCVEFDRAAGWQRERAEQWVREHLHLRDLGRTARLRVPHRMHPDLACFASDVLFAEGYQPAGSSAVGARPVAPVIEFVPVPSLAAETGNRKHHESAFARLRGLKGGAGLESDLADLRHRDPLPSELRPGLPDRGLVNYLEARAVVRTLEAFATDPHFCQGDRKDQNGRAPSDGRTDCQAVPLWQQRPRVAVLALYPAQAELIRKLAQQTARLASAAFDLEIGIPAAFRQRECQVVLVSLTRSHTHRAVSYGEGPQALALALTRARDRLLLFGDPGTLIRRTQWQGRLDHLDETAGARERELIAQLVRYLQGHGAHPRAFHLREGSSA